MNDQLYAEVNETLAAIGWTYNVELDQFEAGGNPVDWQDVMIGLPDLTLNQLDAYAKRMQREARAGRVDRRARVA